MSSVAVVRIAAEEVRASRRLAGDATVSVKIQPGTSKWEFEVNRGVKCERQRESEIVKRTAGSSS